MFMNAKTVQAMFDYFIEDHTEKVAQLERVVLEQKQEIGEHLHQSVKQTELLKLLDQRLRTLEGLKERKESDEPWVELVGGDIDPNKGLQMQLDWNDAFIDQLRAKGYKGTNDGSLVAQWLLTVSNTVRPDDDK